MSKTALPLPHFTDICVSLLPEFCVALWCGCRGASTRRWSRTAGRATSPTPPSTRGTLTSSESVRDGAGAGARPRQLPPLRPFICCHRGLRAAARVGNFGGRAAAPIPAWWSSFRVHACPSTPACWPIFGTAWDTTLSRSCIATRALWAAAQRSFCCPIPAWWSLCAVCAATLNRLITLLSL